MWGTGNTALGMNTQQNINTKQKWWVYWNSDTKQYEYKPVVKRGKKENGSALVSSSNPALDTLQVNKNLTDPATLRIIALKTQNGCPQAQALREQVILLPEVQYAIIKNLFVQSIHQYDGQKYGYARVYLHKIGTLLQTIHPQARELLRKDTDIMKAYPDYLCSTIVSRYYQYLNSFALEDHDDANYKQRYRHHFHEILTLIWVAR